MAIFEIFSPSQVAIRDIQEREEAYYWSRCAEMLLRKHGLVDVRCHDSASPMTGFPIYTRGHNPAGTRRPGFFEGPCAPEVLHSIGLSPACRTATSVRLFDKTERPLGLLCFPRFNVRKIPVGRRDVSDPYPHAAEDPKWNQDQFEVGCFARKDGWEPLAFAELDGESEKVTVAVTDGENVVFGFQIFDLILANHTFPPLEAGYHSQTRSCSDLVHLERWLMDLFADGATRQGHDVVRVGIWPEGHRAAMTLRHDYDRVIEMTALKALLDNYDSFGVKSSWGFLIDRCEPDHAKYIAARGHEVALHSVATTFHDFEVELRLFEDWIGSTARGMTAHGGLGAPGFLGQVQYRWAIEKELLYGEILGRPIGLPATVLSIRDECVHATRLVLPGCHRSLDANTRPEGHYLADLASAIPRAISNGEYAIPMNHPDVHIPELFRLLEQLSLEGVWNTTLREASEWTLSTRFLSRVDGEKRQLVLGGPLEQPLEVRIRSADGERSVVCPPGEKAVRFDRHAEEIGCEG